MISKASPMFAALAMVSVLACGPAQAQQPSHMPRDPRPADPAANLPSDTGVQTTLPSGAVTGAGQPQGTLPQPDDGAPGGVEQRARDRRSGSAADSPEHAPARARGETFGADRRLQRAPAAR